jgi:hypothetical protein
MVTSLEVHAQDSKAITPNFVANAIYTEPSREPVTAATRLVNIVAIVCRPSRTNIFPFTEELLARTRTVRLSSESRRRPLLVFLRRRNPTARSSTGVPRASATPHGILPTSTRGSTETRPMPTTSRSFRIAPLGMSSWLWTPWSKTFGACLPLPWSPCYFVSFWHSSQSSQS